MCPPLGWDQEPRPLWWQQWETTECVRSLSGGNWTRGHRLQGSMYPGCQQLWKLIRYVGMGVNASEIASSHKTASKYSKRLGSRYWCCCQQLGTDGHQGPGPGQGGCLRAATAERGSGVYACVLSTQGSILISQTAWRSWGCFCCWLCCCRWPATHRAGHALGAAEHHCRLSWARGAAAGSPCAGNHIWQSPPKTTKTSLKCTWCWISTMMGKISSMTMWAFCPCNGIHLKNDSILPLKYNNTIMQ